MSVYVGPSLYPFGRMIMCHMVADSLEELHTMADRIGIRRQWFQDTRHPHYDISKGKRHLAILAGAQEADERQVVETALLCRENSWLATLDDPEVVDAILREAGYDPDEVAARMRATADRVIAELTKAQEET